MGSFFDHVFGLYGMTAVMNQHADPVTITYRINHADVTDVTAIRQDASFENRIDPEYGFMMKVWRMKIVVNRDANITGAWGHLDTIETERATFRVDGVNWSIDDAEGEGIQNVTPNEMVISLIRSEPVAGTFADHHRRL